MDSERLRRLLEDLRRGEIDVDTALASLRDLPYEDLGYARLDHHRALRTGYPEVVFCQGKTPEQVATIIERLAERHARVLGTRADRPAADAVRLRVPDSTYHELARIISVDRSGPDRPAPPGGFVVVCAAGTSDLPVAEEAALTAEFMGSRVIRLWDVGVAGLHRLLEHRALLGEARVIVAVAGMEGALASIVGGLVSCPVVAVPTSVGYGASFGGLSALLTMINSCAPGVCVVNIDNGFGAGYVAHLIDAAKTASPGEQA